jgi:hypothetical protein
MVNFAEPMNDLIKPKNNILWSQVALVACLVACIGDLTALIIFARLYPGYNQLLQPISALGAHGSPIARVVSSWWILIGLILLLFAIAYGKSELVQTPVHRLIAWLIGIYAVGEEIGSGVFPGNHVAGHLTSIGIVHNILGGFGVVALMISPFVLMKKYSRTDHYNLNRFFLIISITGILGFLLFSITRLNPPGFHWLHAWHGLWQRLFVADYYAILIVAAIQQFLEHRLPKPQELFSPPPQP